MLNQKKQAAIFFQDLYKPISKKAEELPQNNSSSILIWYKLLLSN